MKTVVTVIFLLIFSLLLLPTEIIDNLNKPQKGTWNFSPKKEWSLDNIEKNILSEVLCIRADKQGNLFVPESKEQTVFIISPKGKLIRKFGRTGQGPGEFTSVGHMFLVNKSLIFPEMGKIHFFSLKGDLIKDVKLKGMCIPEIFIDENRLIKFSRTMLNTSPGVNHMLVVDLRTQIPRKILSMKGEESILKYSKDGNMMSFKVPEVTSTTVFAVHNNNVFYSENRGYEINKIDLEGKNLLTIKVLNRKKHQISLELKKKVIEDQIKGFPSAPKDVLKVMIEQIPNEFPYFHKIFVNDKGFIFALLNNMNKPNTTEIDIFSPQGKYLYNGTIDLSKDFERLLVLDFCMSRNEFFVFAEDKEGEYWLSKYNIQLPQ